MTLPEDFQMPTSIRQAEEMLLNLQGEVEVIQYRQLGLRKAIRGKREVYDEWKKKARHALTSKLDQLRRVKFFIKKERTKLYAEQHSINSDDPEQLLLHLFGVVGKLRNSQSLSDLDLQLLDVVAGKFEEKETT